MRDDKFDGTILQMSAEVSPGLDGLTIVFYTFLWCDMLFKAFSECISTGNFLPSMMKGLIILIPKPYKNNLLRDDCKILAHVYSKWLNKGLNQLFDKCQPL